jgi:RNA polymerase sigma factor (sigma-70 family)
MPGGHPHSVLRFLRALTGPGQVDDAPDAPLLARFAAGRDEAAFAALVQRHGALVWGVCTRVLRHEQDAEDAFQATFLVLARRAGALRNPGLLANWLYGVAYRTAVKARAREARRRDQERQARPMSEASPADEAMRGDLRRVLDDELSRLPDRYRGPVVLCYLEGLTQEEAAQRLGCPRKTVTTRLARACRLLQPRLARRGVTLAAAALAGALPELTAAPPGALLGPTIKAATAFAAGSAPVGGTTPRTAALAEGVLRAMRTTKLTVATALVLGLALAGVGAGAVAYRLGAAEPPKAPEPPAKQGAAPPAAVGPDREAALKKALVEAARKTFEMDLKRLQARQGTTGEVFLWSRRWLEAELEAAGGKEQREAALRAHVARMKELVKLAHSLAATGQGRVADATGADYFLAQAELWLLREQGAKKPR